MSKTDNTPEWKTRHREAVEESLRFFSNENKTERERWVVRRLLETIAVPFKEEELRPGAEPADIEFGEAKFQIKEILDDGRRRTDEYREQLRRIDASKSEKDLLTSFSPKVVTFEEAVKEAYDFALSLIGNNLYGPLEIAQMDLVIYYDKIETYVQLSEYRNFPELMFRSLSFVSNGPCGVLYCQDCAPGFLIERARNIRHGTVL